MNYNREMTPDELIKFSIMENMTVECINEDDKSKPRLYRNSHTHGLEKALNGYNLSCLMSIPDERMYTIYNSLVYEILSNKDKYLSNNALKTLPARQINIGKDNMTFMLYPTKCFGDKTLRIVFADKKRRFPPMCDPDFAFQMSDIDIEPDGNK